MAVTGKTPQPSPARSVLRGLIRRATGLVRSRLWPRVEDIADRAARRHTAAVADQIRADLERWNNDLRRELAELRDEVAATHPLAGRVDWAVNELARMGPHVAALDDRVGTLERARLGGPVDEDELAQARSLVDEVRAEHARVRARLTAIARYEERLSRLEDQVTARDQR